MARPNRGGCPNCPDESEVELVRWAMSIAIERLLQGIKMGATLDQFQEMLEQMQSGMHDATPLAYQALRRLCHEAKDKVGGGAVSVKELIELTGGEVEDSC